MHFGLKNNLPKTHLKGILRIFSTSEPDLLEKLAANCNHMMVSQIHQGRNANARYLYSLHKLLVFTNT